MFPTGVVEESREELSSVTVTVTGSRLEVDWVKVSLTITPNWHWTSAIS